MIFLFYFESVWFRPYTGGRKPALTPKILSNEFTKLSMKSQTLSIGSNM